MPVLKKVPKRMEIAPGAQYTVRLPIGPTYEKLSFYLGGGLTMAQVKNFRVEVRGKPIVSLKSLARLQEMNKHYRRDGSDRTDMVTLWFYRPEFVNIAERLNYAMGTADVDTAVVTMEIDAAAPAESDIEVMALQSGPRPFGVCTKIKEFPQTFAQGGEFDIADLPRRSAAIAGLHLSTDKVTDMKLELDSLTVVEGTTAQIHDHQDEWVDSQAGYSHMNFVTRGTQFDALQTDGVQDFRLKVNLTQAASFDVVVEYFDTYDGL